MRVKSHEAAAFVASILLIPLVARAEPVAAAISTTLATDSKQIRQFAFDGVDRSELFGLARDAALGRQGRPACERWYPVINQTLKSDGHTPSHFIKMRITTTHDGVAAASRGNIVGSTKFFKAHPDDVGAMIHETFTSSTRNGGKRSKADRGNG